MKKKVVKIMFFILIIFHFSTAFAYDFESEIQEKVGRVNTSEIDSFIKELNNKNGEIISNTDLKTYIFNIIKGKENINIQMVINRILQLIFSEIYSSMKLLIQLLILAVLSAILTNLQGAFEEKSISEISFMAVYIIIIVFAIRSFLSALNIGKEAIDNMVNFMQAMLPVLITMLVSVGALASASFFQPAIIITVEFIAKAMKDFVLPVILFMTAIKVVSNLSDKISLNKLGDFMKTITTSSISILLSIFLGVVTIQGLSSSITDGVISRTAKYSVGAFLPVVGGILSDSIDAIISASLLIKGAVGIFGLAAILVIITMPLIKLFSMILVYKFAAAVIEPISDKKIVNLLSDISVSITYVFAVLVSVSVMMFFSITALIGVASISVMMR